jgi:integrase
MPRGRPIIRRKGRNNTGTVYYQKGRKHWAWQVSVGGKRKTGYAATSKEAEAAKLEALHLLKGGLLTTRDPRFAEWAASWLEGKAARVKVGQLKEHTVEGYSLNIRRVNEFIGDLRLSKIRPDHLEQAYVKLLEEGLSASYVNAIHRSVGDCLRTALKKGLIPRDIAAIATAPTAGKSKPYVLSKDEFKSLIRASRQESGGIIIETVLLTGMRIDVEALSLTWPQMDFDNGTVPIGQTKTDAGTGRVIPLDPDLAHGLRRHRTEQSETTLSMPGVWNTQDLVFCNGAGNRMSLVNLRARVFRRVKERAGLPQSLTFHNLRHNFGSHLLSLGVPITTISKMLGHANPGITWAIYMHEIPDDHQVVREAIASLGVPFSS